jgi:hypothetical protein
MYTILVGKPEWKRSLEKPRYRREDVIIDLREIGLSGAGSRQGLVVDSCEHDDK